MRFHYMGLFLFIFNLTLPMISGFAIFNTTVSNYPNWSYTSVAAVYNCSTSAANTTNAGGCTSPSPTSSLFTNFILSFGDWIQVLFKYVSAFAVAVFLPYWYMVNTFHLPIVLAVIYQAGMIPAYGSFISFFLGNRPAEAY